MERTLILYPATFMIILTLFLYVKSYYQNIKPMINKSVSSGYFKLYQGDVTEKNEISR